jgi:hypothetical protein
VSGVSAEPYRLVEAKKAPTIDLRRQIQPACRWDSAQQLTLNFFHAMTKATLTPDRNNMAQPMITPAARARDYQ